MSTVRADNFGNRLGTSIVPSSAVTLGTAKAWSYYNQITPAVISSYNTTSITDNSTGDFTQNFSNGFFDSNFSTASTRVDDVMNTNIGSTTPNGVRTTVSERFFSANTVAGAIDGSNWTQHFGTLA